MRQHVEKKRNRKRPIRQLVLLFGVLFSILTMQQGEAAARNNPSSWMEEGGAVLMQHNEDFFALGLQAFKSNARAAQWTNIPENAGDWEAVAMDGNRILFFYKPGSELAVCTLDENGVPVEWLSIHESTRKLIPVALEGNHILMQRGSHGVLKKIEFDDAGRTVSKKRLWRDSLGWKVRGLDANRIVLEHEDTGDVAVWAANPKTPLFRPYNSFTLTPGWSVRDFAGDFVLIQQGETGAVQLVELGDGYQACQTTELVSDGQGWQAVALVQE